MTMPPKSAAANRRPAGQSDGSDNLSAIVAADRAFPAAVAGRWAKDMKLSWREASGVDLGLLAEWNHQLIRDEGHRNRMTVVELAERMKKWLEGEYHAIVFSDVEPVAYALFRTDESLIYLRQLFVRRDRRRSGIGRAAVDILRREIWPSDVRLTVDVLCQNVGGVAFWRSVGYRDYSLTLEIMPE